MKNIKWLFWSLSLGLAMLSCQKESTNNDSPGENEFVKFTYDITQLPTDDRFGEAQDKGIIQNVHLIPESSGLAVSRFESRQNLHPQRQRTCQPVILYRRKR
jgi:hypothetical protein